MSIFDKFKKKKQNESNFRKLDDEEYYVAKPNFYEKDGEIFGICTLTEGVLTLLQKDFNCEVDGKKIENYKLGIFSITENKIIEKNLDYHKAIYILQENAKSVSDNYILVELNLQELKDLIDKCK